MVEKMREYASIQVALKEARLILLMRVSFLFLEMSDFLALICSSI
jgi:hypothetical protein